MAELTKIGEGMVALAKPFIEEGCKLIDDLLGEGCKVAGGMLGDQIYIWRWRNRIRIAYRAKKIMQENGIAISVLPPGFLMPLLDRAGDVDDAQLQELWARLLASGVSEPVHRHPAFVGLLAQISKDEAIILEYLSREHVTCRCAQDWNYHSDQPTSPRTIVDISFPRQILVYPEYFEAWVMRLKSLDLVLWQDGQARVTKLDDTRQREERPGFICLTKFGRLFVTACIPQEHLA